MRLLRGALSGRASLLPADWPFAVRGGLEAVMLPWLVVVLPTLAIYLGSSRLDAAAALSLGSALRTATGLWSLGLGGSVGTSGDGAGWVVGLPMLTITGLSVWAAYHAVRRARPASLGSAAVLTGTGGLGAGLLVALTGPADSRSWPAVAGAVVVVAFACAVWMQRNGRAREGLRRRWSSRPQWVDPALVLARDTAIGLALAASAVLVAAFVEGADRVTRLHDSLTAGAIVPSLGVIALEVGWLPTMAVWALSWLAGPGFSVGAGTAFTPDHVVAGAVPAVPVLGALPVAPLGGQGSMTGLSLPLVLTAMAGAVVVLRRRRLRQLAPLVAVVAAGGATLLIGATTALACVAASGAIGPGRLAQVGPDTPMTVLLVSIEVGVGLILTTVLIHPTTHALTERGVRSTATAAGQAAQAARTRIDAERESLRRRRLQDAATDGAHADGGEDVEADGAAGGVVAGGGAPDPATDRGTDRAGDRATDRATERAGRADSHEDEASPAPDTHARGLRQAASHDTPTAPTGLRHPPSAPRSLGPRRGRHTEPGSTTAAPARAEDATQPLPQQPPHARPSGDAEDGPASSPVPRGEK